MTGINNGDLLSDTFSVYAKDEVGTDELEASHAVESWAEVKWVEPDFLRTIKLFPAIGVRN